MFFFVFPFFIFKSIPLWLFFRIRHSLNLPLFRIPLTKPSHRNTNPLTEPSSLLYSPLLMNISHCICSHFVQPFSSHSHWKSFTFSISLKAFRSLTTNPSCHSDRKPLFSLLPETLLFNLTAKCSHSNCFQPHCKPSHPLTLRTAIFDRHYYHYHWFVVATGTSLQRTYYFAMLWFWNWIEYIFVKYCFRYGVKCIEYDFEIGLNVYR